MRVALVHDFLGQRGGAERVVAALTRIFPGAPLYTSFYDPDETFDDFRGVDVRTSFIQRLPHGDRAFRMLLPVYPSAFRTFDLRAYDLVISSSTHFGHHVRVRGHHVVYCHNPPRWLYQTQEYIGEGGPAPKWSQIPLKPLLAYLRNADRLAASKPDLYIANSKNVRDRIKRLYRRDAQIVHPPVDIDRFMGVTAPEKRKGGDHYLVVGRLLPYKRIDLAIEVCNRLRAPLVVVGEGPLRDELARLAGPTVRFVGKVGDEELFDLYARAIALIQCGTEDFGIGPLEAAAAGIPCVALRNGGALETVIHGETGILFPEQQGGKLEEALLSIGSRAWDPNSLRRHAAAFDEKAFEARLLDVLESLLGRAAR